MIPVIYREETDRWVRGDRHVRPFVRRMVRKPADRRSGMQKVVDNFIKGLSALGVDYRLNPGRSVLRRADKVISFGLGMRGLEDVRPDTAVVAAIGFPHPAELPHLCEQYRIAKFLQHSPWVLDLARSSDLYRGDIFALWSAGIDTDEWTPVDRAGKEPRLLVYEKIQFDRDLWSEALVRPIKTILADKGIAFRDIRYGGYTNGEFKEALAECTGMIFLSPHESQGLAYQEALACDVPVFAWDPGWWLDPARLKYGRDKVPATSVPFFDERCGARFADLSDFESGLDAFHAAALSGGYAPRAYVLENLTIAKSTRRMLEIFGSI